MKIKYCPKCKSTDIEYKPSVDQAAFGFPPKFKCKNCGYESIAFPEKEK
jgi:transposase-like protein